LSKKSGSLFIKIVILLNAFTIIPALVISFFVYINFKQTITGEVREKLQRISEEKQSKLSLQLTNFENLAHTLAADNYAMDYFKELRRNERIDPDKLQRISANLEKIFQSGQGIYENIGYYHEGRVIVDGIGGKSTKDLLTDNRTIINLIRLAPTTGRPVLVNRISYYEDSPLANTFFMAVELNSVTDKIINNGQHDTMKSIILNENGLVIASDNKEHIMNFNFKEARGDAARFFANMERSGSGIDFLTLDGERHLAAFSKDRAHNLYTITYIPISQYNQKIFGLLRIILFLVLICVSLGLLLSFWLSKKTISNPLNILTSGIQQMTKGDFSATIHTESNDEIGRMGRNLNEMGDQLSSMIGMAMDTAEQVGSGMEEIAAGNQDLSSRTQEQASTLLEISAATDEIAASIQQTAVNSQDADQLSRSTLEVAKEGEVSITETIEAMQQINERSQKISDIIKVVNDIAFQTNLLALNAAVEAARAGEQGRGFAVVAAEVRNLASRTATSSKEIEDLISESVNRVNRGNEAVQRSGEILQKILQNTKKNSDVVMEIASTMEEQSSSSAQITNAIEQLNKVTQQNTALVEEITSSSELLNTHATELAQMLQAFKINGQRQRKRQSSNKQQDKQRDKQTTIKSHAYMNAITPKKQESNTTETLIGDDLEKF